MTAAEAIDDWTERDREVAKAAVLATVDCLLEFSIEVSEELVVSKLYSEALVAGLFIKKLKSFKDEA